MATVQRFTADLRLSGRGGGGHLVEVPDEIVRALGGRGRTPVKATFNGIAYRGSIVKMGGIHMLGVLKSVMAEAGVETGDRLDVTVELDTAQRTVDIPRDLAAAFVEHLKAREAWERLSFTHRREHAEAIAGAKKPETRTRRLQRAIEQLEGPKPKSDESSNHNGPDGAAP
jgi:hypothetical protein